jgi:hypothetical protein
VQRATRSIQGSAKSPLLCCRVGALSTARGRPCSR